MRADELRLDPYSPPPLIGPDPIVTTVGEGNPLRKEDLDTMKKIIEAAPDKFKFRPNRQPVTAEEVRKIVREELARVLRP